MGGSKKGAGKGGRVVKTGPYPSPVTGSGAVVKGNASAGSPTAHPLSRKPKGK